MLINKRKSFIISALFIFALILTALFLILSFMHPTLHLTKTSGFSQKDLKKQSNKLRFVVPDTIDTTKSTYISIKKEWFESSGLGKITEIKAKPGKYLALDFTDRQYDSEVFTIYTKNWFGVKKQHDIIVDYSNYLRVFFPESYDGAAPRKPIIFPYSKLESDYRAKLENLRRYDSFFAYDKKGLVVSTAVHSEEVFNKQNAQGRAFIVNNNTRISLVYDFVLPGIFKDQTQKTQVYEHIEKAVGKAKAYDPANQGLEIKFNTPPFYITKFLGWYYTDPAGNRVDLLPGQEFQIPTWVKSELRLIAKYEMTADTSKLGPALDKQGLVSVSYFDGPERVFFDIVRKGTLLKERVYAKLGYAYQGWYTDPELTKKVDFKKDIADTHTVLYLKSKERPETPSRTHTVNFITRTHANQLLPLTVKHGEKLDSNYSLPTTVSYLDSEGDLHELDYWNLVDPITGTKTKFDFSTQITEDITLEAVLKKRLIPNSKYTIKRYFESVENPGEFIEDISKQEEVIGQVPGQEVELLPHQYRAPEGFNLLNSTVLKKTIERDGTTTFELKYSRNRYTVTYEVNYNGNHFAGVTTSDQPSQTVLYEGKATKPTTPSLTKLGYTYTFKHWQLKDEMGNSYKETTEFDFENTKITKNTTLVAYFEETANLVNYTINHVLPGLNNAVGETKQEIKQATVDTSLTIDENNANPAYLAGFEPIVNSETKNIKADGSTVFTINYRRRKFTVTYEVNYKGNHFNATPSLQDSETVEYEGTATKPSAPTLTRVGYTYTFKHWQLKDEMAYQQGAEFDFENTKITKNTTLVAYFEETPNLVNYTINHALPGLNGAVGETKAEIKQATADTSLTVSETNANPAYLAGFEPIAGSETKNIEADGSTVFTINYRRRKFTVTYEVNYQNHFEGTPSVQNPETVEYEANATQPPMPTITKHGRTYTFKHWQLKDETGNSYNLATPFDFSTKITKNTELVAYFEETIDKVNYKVVHYLEKTGEDNTLNGQYDRVDELMQDQKVEDGATYHDYSALDSNLYEKDTSHSDNLLNSQLTTGDNTTEVRQYYKLREISVKFEKTVGIASFKTAETIMVKKTRKITLPEFNLKDTYNFLGWSLSENGQVQSKFIAGDENIKIYAQTELQNREIIYTVKTQKSDGSYTVNTETKSEKIGTNHTVNYANPDNTMYQNPVYSVDNLTVSADETQNKVTVTINRKTYTVTYQVEGHTSTIPSKTFRHGEKHGEIDESKFEADELGIVKLELDNSQKTKEEIKNLLVTKNHIIKVYVGEPTKIVGKYPQTKVDSPAGIQFERDDVRELKFNSKAVNHTVNFTRKYYKDSSGNRYEMYNGNYYKFEDVEFAKIPKQRTWFTKHIIDFSPFNIYYNGYSDNGKPEHSIFKAMVEEIGKIIGENTYMPTYDDGDFSVKPALGITNENIKLQRDSTDYAKAILGNFGGYQTSYYRGVDLNLFAESGNLIANYHWRSRWQWWLGTQYPRSNPSAYYIRRGGLLNDSDTYSVFGVVVCIR